MNGSRCLVLCYNLLFSSRLLLHTVYFIYLLFYLIFNLLFLSDENAVQPPQKSKNFIYMYM